MAGSNVAGPLAQIGLTPLMAAVLVGAAQNVFSKSAKYALFDPCKEMAYIPLDRETQVRLLACMHACTFSHTHCKAHRFTYAIRACFAHSRIRSGCMSVLQMLSSGNHSLATG